MLLWDKSKLEDQGLLQARVYSHAIDGTPVLMFTLNACDDVFDVQDSQGHVLARCAYRDGCSLSRSQLDAEDALREILARLKCAVML